MTLKIKDNRQMFIIFKAIELASKGFDISHIDFDTLRSTWWNSKTKAFQSKITDNVPDVYIELLPDAQDIFPNLYNNKIKRNHDKQWETIEDFPDDCEKIQLNATSIKQAMTFLKKGGVCNFNGVDRASYDVDYVEELRQLDADYDCQHISGTITDDLSRDKTRKEFRTLAALAFNECDCGAELLSKMQEAFENDADFSGIPEELKKYKIVDNRLYIPLRKSWLQAVRDDGRVYPWADDEEVMFVISKNLYDFFYCSYGSSFQSCFALNSTHGGWQGATINGLHKSCFMLYLTKDHGQKVSMTSEGNKFPAPYMYMRTWCWLCEDGKMHIDKIYSSNFWFYDALLKNSLFTLDEFTRDTSTLKDWEGFKYIQNRYQGYWYPDSIKFITPFKFNFDSGDKCFKGNHNRGNFFSEWLQRVTKVSDTLDLTKIVSLVDGKLFNPKICPITGLRIDDSQDVSEYAKHFKNPVPDGIAVITYIDGFLRVDALSKSFDAISHTHYSFTCDGMPRTHANSDYLVSGNCFYAADVSLDKFKDRMKEDVKCNGYGTVLLRVINGGQVTWIKFRKDK